MNVFVDQYMAAIARHVRFGKHARWQPWRFRPFVRLQFLSRSTLHWLLVAGVAGAADCVSRFRDLPSPQDYAVVLPNGATCTRPTVLPCDGSCLACVTPVDAQIARSSSDLFVDKFGGLGLLVRVPNNESGVAAWERLFFTRYGANVTVQRAGYNASVGKPDMWVVTDVAPKTRLTEAFLGRDLSGRLPNRVAIEALVEQTTPGPTYVQRNPTAFRVVCAPCRLTAC